MHFCVRSTVATVDSSDVLGKVLSWEGCSAHSHRIGHISCLIVRGCVCCVRVFSFARGLQIDKSFRREHFAYRRCQHRETFAYVVLVAVASTSRSFWSARSGSYQCLLHHSAYVTPQWMVRCAELPTFSVCCPKWQLRRTTLYRRNLLHPHTCGRRVSSM